MFVPSDHYVGVMRNASTDLMYERCDDCSFMGQPRFRDRDAAERALGRHKNSRRHRLRTG